MPGLPYYKGRNPFTDWSSPKFYNEVIKYSGEDDEYLYFVGYGGFLNGGSVHYCELKENCTNETIEETVERRFNLSKRSNTKFDWESYKISISPSYINENKIQE